MTRIYIIRHAEAEGNLCRRIQGQTDGMVTEQGFFQIEALEKRFDGIPIDAVYSSDMTRTILTASAIFRPRKLKLVTDPRLREIHMGRWEGLPWGEVEYREPEMLRRFGSDPEQWKVEGAETFATLRDRMVEAVTELADRHDGETIAVLTHGTATRYLLLHALGLPIREVRQVPHGDNTAVSLLIVENGDIRVEFMNDNTHLPEEMSTLGKQKWWRRESGTDGNNLRFRPMDLVRDRDRYLSCRRDAWKAVHGSLRCFSERYLEIAREHAMEHPSGVTEALLGDSPVGILELAASRDARDGAGCIAFLYLMEPYRSRRLGVQLMGEAISVYRSLGRDRLRLNVAEENPRAMAFYARHGFRRVGEDKGAVGRIYVMERDISPERQRKLAMEDAPGAD